MTNIAKLVVLPAIFSVLTAFAITPLVVKIAKNLKLVDDPKSHKHEKVIHTYPVPRGGGLAIFAAILVSALIFLPLDKHLIGILVGALILTVVGIADDKFNLNPYLRLAIQFLAASAPIIAGIGISFITNPFNSVIDLSHPQINFFLFGEVRSIWILSDLFALFWIVTLMNFVNMGGKRNRRPTSRSSYHCCNNYCNTFLTIFGRYYTMASNNPCCNSRGVLFWVFTLELLPAKNNAFF